MGTRPISLRFVLGDGPVIPATCYLFEDGSEELLIKALRDSETVVTVHMATVKEVTP